MKRLLPLLLLVLVACSDDPKGETPTPDAGDDVADTNEPDPDVRDDVGDDADGDAGDATDAEPDVPEVDATPDPTDDASVELGPFTLTTVAAEGSFRLARGEAVLLQSLGRADSTDDAAEDRLGAYAPAAHRHTNVVSTVIAGAYIFERGDGPWTRYRVITQSASTDREITLTLGAANGDAATLRFALDDADNLDVTFTPPPAPDGEDILTSLSFACPENERFYGLGSQSYAAEHRGWRVPIWTREQGIGKKVDPIVGFNGALEDAYAPMGWVMNSAGFGVLLGNSERSVFELCSERDDAWRIETFAAQLRFKIIVGDSMMDLLAGLTEHTGRIVQPPAWTFAPWNDSLQTEERVRALAAHLRENDIPSSAMWVEDWIGGDLNEVTGYHLHYVWYADEERWPNLDGMIDDLHADGFKFFGYFNSFIRKETPMWGEALEGDFLIQTPAGEPYEFIDPIFKVASLVDLTNPDAVAWLRGYQLAAIERGLDGWMADYGEWMPYDAVLSDGRTGAEVHNLYPLMWQAANRANMDEGHPDGDYTFFVRSGFAWTEGGTSGLAPVVWAGDQNTSWDDGDGIKTVVPIGLNLGMTGVPMFTHDIGGYSSAIEDPTTKELWFRWVSLGAFSPVMRTHHGASDEENWMLDRDEESTAHWKRYAIEHTRLYPYLASLTADAVATGAPIFRHTVLEFPQDPEAAGLHYQYMLGDSLLVAPVLDEGATEVRLWLPQGRWAHWWTGEVQEGDQWVTVPAAVGDIPVFLREGGVVPQLRTAPDTLASATAEGITTLDDVDDLYTLTVFPGAARQRTLVDETTIALGQGSLPAQWTTGDATLDGRALPTCATEEGTDCHDGDYIRVHGSNLPLVLTDGLTLHIEGPVRSWYIRVVGAP
jgi:sulfoquinovosidase